MIDRADRHFSFSRAGIVLGLCALGGVLTAAIVWSGLDWSYFVWVQTDGPRNLLRPADRAGYFIPVLVPVLFLLGAALFRSWHILRLALASAGAAVLGLAGSMAIKALSGRASPPHHTFGDALQSADNSAGFHFGFMNERLIGGWPSSHATVHFAVAFALFILWAGRPVLQTIPLLVAMCIGLGVTLGYHWLSDMVAGACLGAAIGLTIGWQFEKWFSATGARSTRPAPTR